MTRDERQQFNRLWAQIENCITNIDPNFDLKLYNKTDNDIGRIQDLVDVLNVYIKYLMLDNEAYERERNTLTKMLMEQSDGQ